MKALLIHRFAVPLPRWGRHLIVDTFGTYGNRVFANAKTNLQHPRFSILPYCDSPANGYLTGSLRDGSKALLLCPGAPHRRGA